MILILKSNSRIKFPTLPKRVTNQNGWVRENPEGKHDKAIANFVTIEQLSYLNYSLWVISAALMDNFCQNGKVVAFFQSWTKVEAKQAKWSKTRRIILFLCSFKKGKFFLEGSSIAPNPPPQFCYWYLNSHAQFCQNLKPS